MNLDNKATKLKMLETNYKLKIKLQNFILKKLVELKNKLEIPKRISVI